MGYIYVIKSVILETSRLILSNVAEKDLENLLLIMYAQQISITSMKLKTSSNNSHELILHV